ncbi:MAG: DUF4442 domain-containing protein [Saprospiraceae bacterium]
MENNTAMVAQSKILRNLNSPWKMWLWFWLKLPSLVFWGVRIQRITPQQGVTSIPAGWRTQNPFRSTYFAAQCGAAELSTGTLAILAVQSAATPVSMLVTQVEASFVKKAVSRITFTCEDGEAIAAAVQKAVTSGEAQVLTATSTGRQEGGEIVSVVKITWSFKAKQ